MQIVCSSVGIGVRAVFSMTLIRPFLLIMIVEIVDEKINYFHFTYNNLHNVITGRL